MTRGIFGNLELGANVAVENVELERANESAFRIRCRGESYRG